MLAWPLAFAALIAASSAIYVDVNNPFTDGALNVTNIAVKKSEGAIMHTNLFFPTTPGEYAVVYFVPGAPDGIIPSFFYDDFLRRVAAHGFIVVGADAYWWWPTPDRKRRQLPVRGRKLGSIVSSHLLAEHYTEFDWLKQNLAAHTGAAVPRWDRVGLACHSAGCEVTLLMILQNTTLVNATLFLEPASNDLKTHTNFTLPAYMYGTEFASQFAPFPCSIKGEDYQHFYDNWSCPKYITEVANFGHCDILSKWEWESCHLSHACKTVGNWSRVYPAYHQFVQGASSAFLIGHLQGRAGALQYIREQSLMPLKMLQIGNDLNCTAAAA